MNILKKRHGAGGFELSLTNGKGNARYGARKKSAIIKALQDTLWTDGVFVTPCGKIIRQLRNGTSQRI